MNSRFRESEKPAVCRHILEEPALHVLLAMQKVEGSNPFSPFPGSGSTEQPEPVAGAELLDCGHCVTSPNKTRRMNASRFSPCRRGSSVQLRSEMVGWASRYSAFSAGASSRQRRRCSTVSR